MPLEILVATPHPAFGELIRLSLEETGLYRVRLVQTGREGLASALRTAFQVAVLDSDIQDEPFGSLVSRLRERVEGLKLIVIPPENDPSHPSLAGIVPDGYLRSPFYLPDLLEEMAKMVSTPGGVDDQPGLADAESAEFLKELPWLETRQQVQARLVELVPDMAAQALLIARSRQVFAFTGDLADPAIQEINNSLGRFWDNQEKFDLVRYIHLGGDGKDSLLYAAFLADDLIVALVYSTAAPLSRIRSQIARIKKELLTRPPEVEKFEEAKTEPVQVAVSSEPINPDAEVTSSVEVEPAVESIETTFLPAAHEPLPEPEANLDDLTALLEALSEETGEQAAESLGPSDVTEDQSMTAVSTQDHLNVEEPELQPESADGIEVESTDGLSAADGTTLTPDTPESPVSDHIEGSAEDQAETKLETQPQPNLIVEEPGNGVVELTIEPPFDMTARPSGDELTPVSMDRESTEKDLPLPKTAPLSFITVPEAEIEIEPLQPGSMEPFRHIIPTDENYAVETTPDAFNLKPEISASADLEKTALVGTSLNSEPQNDIRPLPDNLLQDLMRDAVPYTPGNTRPLGEMPPEVAQKVPVPMEEITVGGNSFRPTGVGEVENPSQPALSEEPEMESAIEIESGQQTGESEKAPEFQAPEVEKTVPASVIELPESSASQSESVEEDQLPGWLLAEEGTEEDAEEAAPVLNLAELLAEMPSPDPAPVNQEWQPEEQSPIITAEAPSLPAESASLELVSPEAKPGESEPRLMEVPEPNSDAPTQPVVLRRTELIPVVVSAKPESGTRKQTEEIVPEPPPPQETLYSCVLIPAQPSQYLIGGLADNVHQWMVEICHKMGWKLSGLVVRPAHIQFSIQVSATISPGYVLQIIRQHTSRSIFESFPALKAKLLNDDFWSTNYLLVHSPQPPAPEIIREFIRQSRLQQQPTRI